MKHAAHYSPGCWEKPKWKKLWAVFIEALAKHGVVTQACRESGLERNCAYLIKQSSLEREREWLAATEASVDHLIYEARRRAAEGVHEDVYYQGDVVGQKINYSDSLLMFLIKGQRPLYSTERREISGPNGALIPVPMISLNTLSDDDLRELLRISRKLKQPNSDKEVHPTTEAE
jgi:hypothetical protein